MTLGLFPKCEFKLTQDGPLRAGGVTRGNVELVLPEATPRADHLDIVFTTTVKAGYGSGKGRHVEQREMFTQPFRVDVPGGLAAGTHRFAFDLHLPAELPSAYQGNDCSIEHRVDLRLDVDWAVDPTASFVPVVAMAPRREPAHRTPIVVRSPDAFHEAIVLEVLLDSTTVVRGEAITGQLALRTGHAADFDSVILQLVHGAGVAMYRNDLRSRVARELVVSANDLRRGVPFRFTFPTRELPPSNRNGFLDLWSTLQVSLNLSWWSANRTFAIPLDVLPVGSLVADGGPAPTAVGSMRLGAIAAELARATGLRLGKQPVLVEGADGMVKMALEDASRGSEFAALHVFTYPDLALGLRSRPRGILPARRSLAPAELAEEWTIACADDAPKEAVGKLAATALASALGIESLYVSDRRLSFRQRLVADAPESWLDATRRLQMRAREIARAIAELPARDPGSLPAWERAARVENAFLLRHVPSLAEVRRTARTHTGEERSLVATLSTRHGEDGTTTRLEIDLDADVPADAVKHLHEGDTDELARALLAAFTSVDVPTPRRVIAETAGFTADPEPVLALLDSVLAWSMKARGERRVDAPYR